LKNQAYVSISDQEEEEVIRLIRENPASRGTEASAEVLVSVRPGGSGVERRSVNSSAAAVVLG
jgi:hypothetical protein